MSLQYISYSTLQIIQNLSSPSLAVEVIRDFFLRSGTAALKNCLSQKISILLNICVCSLLTATISRANKYGKLKMVAFFQKFLELQVCANENILTNVLDVSTYMLNF